MSPVPVVSATLTTRTVREVKTTDGWVEFYVDRWGCAWSELVGVAATRERLTVDPLFVPLPEAPDLTCRECRGTGIGPDHKGYVTTCAYRWSFEKSGAIVLGWTCPEHLYDCPRVAFTDDGPCKPCGGTGVSPVYAATWQVKWERAASTWWLPEADGEVLAPTRAERRQVVERRATDVTVLPVLTIEQADDRDVRDCFVIEDDGSVWIWVEDNEVEVDIATEPWAVDLRPGQFVLRLDGWEHLKQPHTEMLWWRHGPGYDDPERRRLSVPDGVLSWMELV